MKLGRLFGAPVRFVVALAIIARDLIAWAGGPLWRWIARLRLLTRLSDWVATLPRWGVLLALAAPIAVSEPLKLGGLYLLAVGQFELGVLLQIVGHGLSILLVERIVHAGLPQLLTYRWFAWSWGWIQTIQATIMGWPIVVATREAARAVAAHVRGVARSVVRDVRGWLARFTRG